MIELESLTYSYPESPKPDLGPLDLVVEAGEFLLVAGPSGCGKTSLLRVFNGLAPHFHGGTISGSVRVFSTDPIAVGPRGMSHLVGFVHQNPESHFVTQIVEDELAFAMENHGMDLPTMQRRVEEVLDQLSIAHLRDREIDTLSGGERQRVAIAGVLTLQPRVLVLDEPTSQLDPQSAEEVLVALRALNEDLGLTLVMAEHRLERVAKYADRVLLMGASRALRVGDPAEVLAGSPLAPPLVRLCDHLGWRPPTLTIKATRRRPEFRRLKHQPPPTNDDPDDAAAGLTATAPPAISADNLWFSYPSAPEALKGLNLEVPTGSLTALLGRNGSGKSTLLKALVGLIRPQRGRVRLRAGDRTLDPQRLELHQVAQDVGFVPQNPSRCLFHETVRQELEWSLAQRQQQDHGSRQRLDDLTDTLGIAGLMDRHPRQLSTGERQRVALATALAGDPSILLLDEPTRGLDSAIKDRMASWLTRQRQRGVTVLMATHDVELVARCADHTVLLGGGRHVAAGPTRQLLHGSPVFSTEIHRLFGDRRWHTLDDVRRDPVDKASDTSP